MEENKALLFEDYLQKKLSEEERTAFENKLTNDPAFAEEFSIYNALNTHLKNIHSNQRAAVQQTVSQAGDTYFSVKKTKVFTLKPWHYSVAASVLLLIGISIFTFNTGVSYDDYAFSNTISLVERSNAKPVIKSAETSFNQKNYKKAIEYFNQILTEQPDNNEVLFYKGIALVETNNYTAAELVFTKLQQSQSIYKNKALFYLALTKLKQKDYEGCKKLLITLPETAEDYPKAKEILRKLD